MDVTTIFQEIEERKNLLDQFRQWKKRKRKSFNIFVTERARREMADQDEQKNKKRTPHSKWLTCLVTRIIKNSLLKLLWSNIYKCVAQFELDKTHQTHFFCIYKDFSNIVIIFLYLLLKYILILQVAEIYNREQVGISK